MKSFRPEKVVIIILNFCERIICLILKFLAHRVKEPPPIRARFVFTGVIINGNKFEGDIKNMELRFGQTVRVTASPVDADGNPASIDEGSANWSSADDTIASVEVDPDNELEAIITAFDRQGSTSISIEADGDAGESVSQIFGSGDVRVLGANAVGFDLNFSTPADGA